MTELTAEIIRELLEYDPDTGVFSWRERDRRWFSDESSWKKWNGRFSGSRAGSNSYGYLKIRILHRFYQAHRLAWLYMSGSWPVDQIDHVNGIRDDNRFDNLRAVSNAENLRNQGMRSTNTSGFKGVSWDKQTRKWKAQITITGRHHYLGSYDTPEEARGEYIRAAEEAGFSDRHIYGEAA